MTRQQHNARRRFLQQLTGSFALGAVSAFLPQIGLIPRAMAQSSDYKALVCVYLAGANDAYNWLVPRDSNASGSHYQRYVSARGGVYSASNTAGLALNFDDLLPIRPQGSSVDFGLHPSHVDFSASSDLGSQAHSGLQTLFNQGKAAFVCNVGPLLQPISKTGYDNGEPRPPQLFSHNDQEFLWHVGVGNQSNPVARYGWGGRVATAIAAMSVGSGLSPAISTAGAARFLVGDGLLPYQLSGEGVNTLDNYSAVDSLNYSAARRAVLDELLGETYTHPFEQGYASTVKRSLQVGEELDALLNANDGSGNVDTIFPTGNSLAAQLNVVARMIKISRDSLMARRQVYFVRYGSFDLHDGMFVSGGELTDSGHGELLTAVNEAIGAFWTALGEIGARGQVTTFTMSEFGRTLSGNGSGSDHAWGGNMLVLGDAVQGGRLFGTYPQLILNNNDDSLQDWSFNRGQYIPTTATEQFAATLARWMGATDSSVLDAIFPNLSKFSTRDLGFMA
ncbi:DUF1501 domain-containing protein [Pseudomarimonas arenosa]|uniref:DUF1501 domain-containing protein n=1 Tax=Pseudomarimonas arenosa TaxID=2774145 RepID=A0AAW3ZG86_9GAMM|nr:DUF1501 domain-containing protein [Pseudomarimonas arenosa]MBD8525073.1 DUF1501 domain-containing protein [Pseudomarimonas arenosa]